MLVAMTFVHNTLNSTSDNDSDTFVNSYAQLEYHWQDRWTGYARYEYTFGADNDPYLEFFPDFVKKRALAGLRLDVAKHHALTLEFSKDHLQGHKSFGSLVLQWTALF